jgi:hypothetical protein
MCVACCAPSYEKSVFTHACSILGMHVRVCGSKVLCAFAHILIHTYKHTHTHTHTHTQNRTLLQRFITNKPWPKLNEVAGEDAIAVVRGHTHSHMHA